MIAIAIANSKEWLATLKYFDINQEVCLSFPYGEYFIINKYNKDLLFYKSGARKTNASGAAQYIIDKFSPEKVIVLGTCAGIDPTFKMLDIIIPNKAVQYDCTVTQIDSLIHEKFVVDIDLSNVNFTYKTGVIATADKPVIMLQDAQNLLKNNITVAEMEAAAVAYVCKLNKVGFLIVKGISDFALQEVETKTQESIDKQHNTFVKNIPLIMNNIFENYLEKII